MPQKVSVASGGHLGRRRKRRAAVAFGEPGGRPRAARSALLGRGAQPDGHGRGDQESTACGRKGKVRKRDRAGARSNNRGGKADQGRPQGRPCSASSRFRDPPVPLPSGERIRPHAARQDSKGDRMLILTRKPGESIIVEESVRITVLEVRGSQVKLGIQAPQEVRVNREEVLERQRAESNLPPLDTLPALSPAPRASNRPAAPRSASRSENRSAGERTDGDRGPSVRRADGSRHHRPHHGSARSGQRSPRSSNPPYKEQYKESAMNRPPSPGPADPPLIKRQRPGRPLAPHRPPIDDDLDEMDPPAGTMRRYRLPEGRQPFGRRWTPGRTHPPSEIEPVDPRGIDPHGDPGPEPEARPEDAAPQSGQAGAGGAPLDDQSPPTRPRRRAGGEAA